MMSLRFCPVCGAGNKPAHTHCFACGQILTIDSEQGDMLLHGRYRPDILLGSGGFSRVYHARDLQEDGREVALKQIHLQGLSAEEVIEATDTFNREVALLSTLRHPQIPQLYDHFRDQNHWYLVLEYLQGTTLETYLETRMARGRPIGVDEALSLVQQVCVVLEYLHTRQPAVIFRDLKPGNIMRTPSGRLCLIDFGIARQYRPGQLRDTQRLGSPGYAAPEQYGRTQTTAHTDIYSLGVLLRTLLSGQDAPPSPQGLAPLSPGASAAETDLATLLQQMLADDPAERPADARSVAAALEQVQQALRAVDERERIWVPPSSQEVSSAPSGSQYQILLPASPELPAREGHFGRRKMLGGIGGLAAMVISGEILWQALHMGQTPEPKPAPAVRLPPANLLYTYRNHSDAVWNAAWSPNALRIASCSLDTTAQVWDALTGSNPFIYRGQTDVLMDVAWSPDGKRIASTSYDKTVQVWNAADGSNVVRYHKHTAAVMEASWSPDGTCIASCSFDKTVQIWTAADGRALQAYLKHTGEVYSVKWSPDGRRLASASQDHTVHVWDAATMQTLVVYRGHGDCVYEVAWSPDGTRLASASRDGTVHLWNEADGGDPLVYRGHTQAVNGVAWSPDGTQIASVSDDTTVRIWNARDGKTFLTYTGHTQPVIVASWSPGGTLMASTSQDATVQVWRIP